MNRKTFIACITATDASNCGKMSNLPSSFANLIPRHMQHTNTGIFFASSPEYHRVYSAANANEIDWPFFIVYFY